MASNPQPSSMATAPTRTRLLVSLATGPFLVGLVAGRALEHLLQDLGKASEELFRGDRLPALPLEEAALEEAGRRPTP